MSPVIENVAGILRLAEVDYAGQTVDFGLDGFVDHQGRKEFLCVLARGTQNRIIAVKFLIYQESILKNIHCPEKTHS